MTVVFKNLQEVEASDSKTFNLSYWYGTSKKQIAHNENHVVETASTIKLLIMAKLLHEASKNRIDLERSVKINADDVGRHGSGILQYFSLPESMKLSNLMTLMMTVSDNTATNVLIKILGIEEINGFAQRVGLKNTKLLMKKLDFEDTVDFSKPLVGQTTAYEMATLIERILSDNFLNLSHKEKAIALLKASQTSMIKPQLRSAGQYPSIRHFGSKTGRLTPPGDIMFIGEVGFIIDQNDTPCVFAQYLLANTANPAAVNQQKFAAAASLLYDEWSNLNTTHAKKTHSTTP